MELFFRILLIGFLALFFILIVFIGYSGSTKSINRIRNAYSYEICCSMGKNVQCYLTNNYETTSIGFKFTSRSGLDVETAGSCILKKLKSKGN